MLSDRDRELAIKAIDDYFVSGNDVPVGRATIKREEWEAVKAFLAERDQLSIKEKEDAE